MLLIMSDFSLMMLHICIVYFLFRLAN